MTYKRVIAMIFEATSEEALPTIADVRELILKDPKPTWTGREVKLTESPTWREA